MCFSADASFTSGTVLLTVGAYCVRTALRKNPQYLALAAVPVWFGVQQLSEGFVWEGLEHGDPALTRVASLVFLFFALALWPFWFSFLGAIGEVDPRRRRWFIAFTLLTTVWFWVLFYPLLVGPESLLQTRVVHHSIHYHFHDLAIHKYVPKIVLRIMYLASVAVPMMVGTVNWGRLPGVILGGLALITFLVFDYAFVSVWCFFAAILGAYVAYLLYRLPEPARSKAPVGLEKQSCENEKSPLTECEGI